MNGKKVTEGHRRKSYFMYLAWMVLQICRLAIISMGKVIDDGRHPWLSSSERIDLDPTNATNRDRGVVCGGCFCFNEGRSRRSRGLRSSSRRSTELKGKPVPSVCCTADSVVMKSLQLVRTRSVRSDSSRRTHGDGERASPPP